MARTIDKAGVRCKIEPRYAGTGVGRGWGLHLVVIEPFHDAKREDGCFLAFGDMGHAKDNAKILSDNRVWMGLAPLAIVE